MPAILSGDPVIPVCVVAREAQIERAGYPVDRESYERVIRNLDPLKSRLIADFGAEHGPSPYVRNSRGAHNFSFRQLEAYLASLGLLSIWEKTPKSRLKMKVTVRERRWQRHLEQLRFFAHGRREFNTTHSSSLEILFFNSTTGKIGIGNCCPPLDSDCSAYTSCCECAEAAAH